MGVVCAQSVLLNLATLANVVEEPGAESPAAIKLMLQVRRRLCAHPADSVDKRDRPGMSRQWRGSSLE